MLTILLLHLIKGIKFKQVMIISILLISGWLVFMSLSGDTINFYLSTLKINDILENKISDFDSTNSSLIRLALWKMAIQKFTENPIIGVGFAQSDLSAQISNITSSPIYPHNIFLEIASELGIIGLILFIIPLLSGIKKAYSVFQNTNTKKYIEAEMVLLLLVYNLIEAQISGFITNQSQLLFMMGIAGGLYQWEVIPQCEDRKKLRKRIFKTYTSSSENTKLIPICDKS
jgi:O-antigen ligase